MLTHHRFRSRAVARPLARSIVFALAGACALSVPAASFAARPIEASDLPLPEIAPRPLIAQATPVAGSMASDAAVAGDTTPPPIVPPAASERPSASESVTVNLINRLVQRGVLTKEDSAELMQQAEQDAAEAKALAAAQQDAAVQAAVQQAVAAAQQQAAQFTPAPDLMPPEGDALRIPYIPEPVKAQLREDLRHELLTSSKTGWTGPKVVPDWVERIKLFGDIRVRYENVLFPDGNDNTGAFPNFNAINTGAPYDISGFQFAPQLNVDEDRQRFRIRARLGLEADLTNGFTAGMRIATGENNSPTSTNQSLGLAGSGQGGQFSKYAIWLDRAFLKYQVAGDSPSKLLTITAGRFDNPFFSSEIIWDDDLGFDGAALQAKYPITSRITPFVNLGAFIVFNTDFNFSSIQPDKFPSDDKYLYAAQGGFEIKLAKDWNLKIAAAYYHFDNVDGRLSSPFTPLTAQDAGDTDGSRPSFAQKGNTYFPIRNIVPNALNNFGTTNQFQYFGLATPFEEVALTGKLEYNGWEPFQVSLSGEWIKNLAFDRGALEQLAVNNRGPDRAGGTLGKYEGGDTAWIVNLRVGNASMEKFGDWSLGMNYRYVESDAVVDGFADSDFGGGGTNVKGYSLFGTFAFTRYMWLGVRWMSANEVAGPQYKQDILQIDLNGKF